MARTHILPNFLASCTTPYFSPSIICTFLIMKIMTLQFYRDFLHWGKTLPRKLKIETSFEQLQIDLWLSRHMKKQPRVACTTLHWAENRILVSIPPCSSPIASIRPWRWSNYRFKLVIFSSYSRSRAMTDVMGTSSEPLTNGQVQKPPENGNGHMDADEDDPIIHEIPVFLAKSLAQQLYLFQVRWLTLHFLTFSEKFSVILEPKKPQSDHICIKKVKRNGVTMQYCYHRRNW